MTSSRHRLDGLARDSVVHGYRIERILGSGAFGISYLAEHTLFRTWHVIKEYMPDNALRDQMMHVQPKSEANQSFFSWGMANFLEEANILHGMSNPHIVKVTDLFQDNGTAYFVMPFLQGCTLHQWIQSNPMPGQKDMESLFIPLLEGLKYIHSRNLLHRDIKPENIFITDKGHPVLIDFGASRFVIGVKSKALTQILTPHFAPIEQYASKGTFTPALDIYSLAGCMYYAMTHELPVEAPDRIQHDPQPRLLGSIWQKRYSPAFLSAIDKALSLGARDRFQNAFDFQRALLADEVDLVFSSSDGLRPRKEDLQFKSNTTLSQQFQDIDLEMIEKFAKSCIGFTKDSLKTSKEMLIENANRQLELYGDKLSKFIDEISTPRSNDADVKCSGGSPPPQPGDPETPTHDSTVKEKFFFVCFLLFVVLFLIKAARLVG